MAQLILFYPEGHQEHALRGHPERPERVEAVREGLERAGYWDSAEVLAPLPISREVLERIHTPGYLDELQEASASGRFLDPDTYTTPSSWDLALKAAGGGAAVAEAVWDGEETRGFALTRPPGHHAAPDRGMGFCLLNNAALAAEYLIKEKGARRLALIDIDLHHGNGTQDIFYQRDDVLYVSLHQSPFYPGTGDFDETGAGLGEDWTVNLPLPSGSGDQAYRALTREVILPVLEDRQPEMLLISYGFDAHPRDPLGGLRLSGAGYHQAVGDLVSWAERACGGKTAVILEGGYDMTAGRICSAGVTAALLGGEWQDPLGGPEGEEADQWKHVLNRAVERWTR